MSPNSGPSGQSVDENQIDFELRVRIHLDSGGDPKVPGDTNTESELARRHQSFALRLARTKTHANDQSDQANHALYYLIRNSRKYGCAPEKADKASAICRNNIRQGAIDWYRKTFRKTDKATAPTDDVTVLEGVAIDKEPHLGWTSEIERLFEIVSSGNHAAAVEDALLNVIANGTETYEEVAARHPGMTDVNLRVTVHRRLKELRKRLEEQATRGQVVS